VAKEGRGRVGDGLAGASRTPRRGSQKQGADDRVILRCLHGARSQVPLSSTVKFFDTGILWRRLGASVEGCCPGSAEEGHDGVGESLAIAEEHTAEVVLLRCFHTPSDIVELFRGIVEQKLECSS